MYDGDISKKNEIEVDLDKLPDSLLQDLYSYAKQKINAYEISDKAENNDNLVSTGANEDANKAINNEQNKEG